MTAILLAIYLIFLWLVNLAPALNLPLVPEISGVALALFLLGKSSRSSESLSFVKDKNFAPVVLLFGFLIALVSFRAVFAFFEGSIYENTCGQLIGAVQKLECIFQADARQNYALRTFSYVLTAASLFGASFIFCRTNKKAIPSAIIFVSTLFVILTLGAHYAKTSPLPPYIFNNPSLHVRLAFLMENPTWIWPYLFPGMLCLIHYGMNTSGLKRAGILALLALHAFLLLKTQQRGAWLLLFVLLFAFAGLTLVGLINRHSQPNSKKRYFLFGGAGFLLASFAVVVALGGYKVVFYLFPWIDFGERMQTTSPISYERLEIWKIALEGLKGHWLTGYGYASWVKTFLPLSNHVAPYDTAHNFFVQSLFELGALHTLLIFGFFLFFFRYVWRQNKSPSYKKLALYGVLGIGTILAVQEIDFVRSTYYLGAGFLGWFFALPLKDSVNTPPDKRGRMPYLFYGAAAFLCLGAAIFSSAFSLAGYQYEASFESSYARKVRWLRPFGSISYINGTSAEKDLFAVYTIEKAVGKSMTVTSLYFAEPTKVNFGEKGSYYLPLKARSFFSLPDLIEIDGFDVDNGRSIAAMVQWPPILSRIPVLYAEGSYDWEIFPDARGAVKWCKKECFLRLAECPKPNEERQLTIALRHPDIALDRPVKLTYGYSNDKSFGLHYREIVDLNSSVQLPVKSGQPIHIAVDRVYMPPGDGRELGFLLMDSTCSPANEAKAN